MKLYDNVTSFLSGTLRLFFRVKVVGAENEGAASEPVIVCANHMSNWDPVILACVTKRSVSFMAKAELFRIPVVGGVLKLLGAFPVNRGTSDIAAIKMTLGVLKNGGDICMFPQGTRYVGVDPAQTEVKSGVGMLLNHSKVSVLPVGVYTKDYRIRLFRRVYIIIGKPRTYDSFCFADNSREEYQRVSDEIFSDVCALVKNAKDGAYDK